LIAERFGIPIVEDDPYRQLRYEGEHLTPLVALDRENVRSDEGYSVGNVLYLSTFSKTLSPGLRLGWIVAPPDVIVKLVQLRQGADLHTSTFGQMVAYEVARDGFLEEHIKLIRRVYGERRDVMLEALEEFCPPEVTWTRPLGGLFLWVELPVGMDCHQLFDAALKQNVAFVPGDSFYAPSGYAEEGLRHLRLNFSNAKPERIREGVRRLALAMKDQLAGLHGEPVAK
jgi:2-aminoadipate transaminase